MARKIDNEPVQKHTLNLYEGDFEEIKSYFPDLGAAIVIRKLVRQYVLRIRGERQMKLDQKVSL